MIIKQIIRFFDKLEDKVRGFLSRYPIWYALIAGIGAVLFFRGVWYLADVARLGAWVSLGAGMAILLLIGVFVSQYVGDHIIMSGLKQEKKVTEKTASQMKSQSETLKQMSSDISELREAVKGQHQDVSMAAPAVPSTPETQNDANIKNNS